MSHQSCNTSGRCWKALSLAIATLVLLTVFNLHVAHAQVSTGDIIGSVADSTGAAIPGATVIVTDVDTGTSRTGVSTAAGDFVFPLLQTGTYKVVVSAPNFKQFEESAVPLTAGSRIRIDAQLTVGNAGESVLVNGATGRTPDLLTRERVGKIHGRLGRVAAQAQVATDRHSDIRPVRRTNR